MRKSDKPTAIDVYSLNVPNPYRLDPPSANPREVLKEVIGVLLFTLSAAAFVMGIYLA